MRCPQCLGVDLKISALLPCDIFVTGSQDGTGWEVTRVAHGDDTFESSDQCECQICGHLAHVLDFYP